MATDRRLRLNIVWMLTGNLWQGLSQWALLVVLAKLGNIDMVGSFALALAVGWPVLMFSSLSLRAIQVTDCKGSYRFREYLAVRLLTTAAAMMLITGIAVAARYPAEMVASIALVGAAKAIECVSDIFYGRLQREERMAGVAISMILRGTLSVCILGAGVYFTQSLVWGAAGLALASAFTLLACDIPMSLSLLNSRLSASLRECAWYAKALLDCAAQKRLWTLAFGGLPLGVVLMLVSLNLNLPRYFIEHNLGMRELAIFSSIANLLAVGNVVMNAVGQGVAPRLAKYFAAAKMREFRALLSTLVVASLGMGAAGLIGAILFGRQALAIIYRPEYSARHDVLVWLMAGSGFFYLGSTLGYAVTAVKCFSPQLPLFALAAATTALSSMILVPLMGLRGAAFAILISGVIQSAGAARLLTNACKRVEAIPVAACQDLF